MGKFSYDQCSPDREAALEHPVLEEDVGAVARHLQHHHVLPVDHDGVGDAAEGLLVHSSRGEEEGASVGSGEVLEDLRVYRTELGPASQGITDLGNNGNCFLYKTQNYPMSVRPVLHMRDLP